MGIRTDLDVEPPAQAAFSPAALERAAAVFEAISELSRLQLVTLLMDGERSVGEIAAQSSEGLSTVSQRLKVLLAVGMVARRRNGKHIYYRLADQHITDLILNALTHAQEDLT